MTDSTNTLLKNTNLDSHESNVRVDSSLFIAVAYRGRLLIRADKFADDNEGYMVMLECENGFMQGDRCEEKPFYSAMSLLGQVCPSLTHAVPAEVHFPKRSSLVVRTLADYHRCRPS